MFYQTGQASGLPHNPFKAIVAPRPIGWVSTIDRRGNVNLAPYSYFNALGSNPDLIAFASEGQKDSVQNIKEVGEFVYNLVTLPLVEQMNLTSAVLPRGQNEFDFAKLKSAPSKLVKPPRVADTPAAFECKVVSVQALHDIEGKSTDGYLIIGQVVGVHIQDEYLVDGQFDMVKAQTVARCGYRGDYVVVEKVFELLRPKTP
jgi:flavin reductase (DIM6/NTAB) family NADH-FMN oxidoreductase RutF